MVCMSVELMAIIAVTIVLSVTFVALCQGIRQDMRDRQSELRGARLEREQMRR